MPSLNPVPGVRLWNLATQKEARWLRGKDFQVFDIDFSADGKILATAIPKANAEARRCMEGILAQIDPASSADLRRGLRAVELLEWIGAADARQILKTLANGDPHARLTREAKSALQRLSKRGGK